MGVLYDARRNQIATFEYGNITDVRYWNDQRIIAKYYGNKVEECFSNSSSTIGHVSGNRGYLGSPYLASTGTPFIYADSCSRIYLYSTHEHVADFEGDTIGALLAYIAYYCDGRAPSISQTNEKSFVSNTKSSSNYSATSVDSIGVPDVSGYGCLGVILGIILIYAVIGTSLFAWKDFGLYFLCQENSTTDELWDLYPFFIALIAGVVAFMRNKSKGYISFVESYTKVFLVATIISIIALYLEGAGIIKSLFGGPFLMFILGWPVVLVSFIVTKIILYIKK